MLWHNKKSTEAISDNVFALILNLLFMVSLNFLRSSNHTLLPKKIQPLGLSKKIPGVSAVCNSNPQACTAARSAPEKNDLNSEYCPQSAKFSWTGVQTLKKPNTKVLWKTARKVSSLDYFSRLRIANYMKSKDFSVAPPVVEEVLTSEEQVGESPKYVAYFSLPLGDESNRTIQAVGYAISSKDAEVCACMHAEDLLGELDVPIYSDSKRQEEYSLQRQKEV